MSHSPVNLLHRRTFIARMVRPAIFVFFLGFLLSGIFAGFWERGIELPVLQMAQRQFARLPLDLMEMPRVCLSAGAPSSFQAQYCSDRWNGIGFRLFGVLLPFLCVFAFLMVARRVVFGLYREMDRLLREGRQTFIGVATDPPKLPKDFYGSFHCFVPISVQVKGGKQLRVYLPAEEDFPKPGAKIAVAPLGKRFGAVRYAGVIYIPHVSVVSGAV